MWNRFVILILFAIVYGLYILIMSRTYAFQSESRFYSCLNVKELLARNRRIISEVIAFDITSYIASVSSKEFLDIQATIKCGFNRIRVLDMIRSYSQMYRTETYSQHSSIIWPDWLNGWGFIYKPSGWGFELQSEFIKF